MSAERKYQDGQIVYTREIISLKMVIIDAKECLKGWRYKLGFTKKDGTVDKRYSCRFYFEDKINN